jgi:hypothetical protein
MMRSVIWRGLLVCSSSLLFAACNSVPNQESVGYDLARARMGYAAQCAERARAFEADNALRQALEQWELVLVVDPGSREAQAEVVRLRHAIEGRVAHHSRAAKKAMKRSDYRAARLAMLKALALKPDDAALIAELRSIEGRSAYAILADAPRVSDKVESEIDVYTAPGARSANETPAEAPSRRIAPAGLAAGSDPLAKQRDVIAAEAEKNTILGLKSLSRRQYAMALELFLRAKAASDGPNARLDSLIDTARQALAEHHYEQGVNAFRSANYGLAVNEFEQALHYAPDHHRARFYYSSAKQLQGTEAANK